MATYYTIARNYKNDRLKVPIESKHSYKNPNSISDTSVINYLYDYVGKVPTDPESSTLLLSAQYGNKAEKNTANILYCSNKTGSTHYPNGWNWQQGTAANEVIGNKIMVKSVRLHYEITLNHLAFYYPVNPFYIQKESNVPGKAESKQNILIADDNDNSNRTVDILRNTAWRRDYRVQVLHFDDDLPTSDDDIKIMLSQWYDTTYVPTTINETSGNDKYGYTLEISNKTDMKRESTGWTGKFKIIKEFQFSLSTDKPYYQFDITLDPHRQVNLGKNTSDGKWYITDDWWRNTIVVMWNPMNYKIDMDPQSAYALTAFTSTPSATGYDIGEWTYMAKLTYYDV